MATKSQLKEYFKSQKIPIEAQFGTLIDSNFLLPKNQVDNTIQFGNGDESGKPHLRAYRHVRKNETVQGKNYRVDYHMFLTLDSVDVNCPVFVIMTRYNTTDKTSETRFGEFTDMNESSGAGIDFFDKTDEECIAILESISYYKFAKEGSSNQDTFKYYRYSNDAQQFFYNFIFEIHTVVSTNGYEITVPTRITEINGSINIDSSYEWILMPNVNFSDIEIEWNSIKDNLDNLNVDIIIEFRNQWYKQANK
jgi:hypothetical protein